MPERRDIRLGLLDAIPSEFYLAGEKTDPQKFIDMFASAGLEFDYVTYHAAEGEMPAGPADCDAYLVTGSPCSVYEELDWIGELEAFVREAFAADTPQVGVCFGHQLAARALGGHVARAETGWVLGRQPLIVNTRRPWMDTSREAFSLHYINQDQVIDLPPAVELLGESARCPNALYAAGDRLLCIQPHPEQPRRSMEVFSDYLLDKGAITAAEHRAACDSLDGEPPDSVIVAGWLGRFIIGAVESRRARGDRG